MKVVFAAYRDWALQTYARLKKHPRVSEMLLVTSIEQLELLITGNYNNLSAEHKHNVDLVMLCGWSWQVSKDLLKNVTVVSEHPAYLDEYSLGTPIQNQILDGIIYTKHRVVKIGFPELGERLYSPKHEVDMNLTGNMSDIMSEMCSTATTIYNRFLDDYPNINWEQWQKCDEYRKPRIPKDSKINIGDFKKMSTEQMYDYIRMLEDPYPNACIEDELGVLTFEKISYKKKL